MQFVAYVWIFSWPHFSTKVMVIAKYCNYVVYRLKNFIKQFVIDFYWYGVVQLLRSLVPVSSKSVDWLQRYLILSKWDFDVLIFFMGLLCHMTGLTSERTVMKIWNQSGFIRQNYWNISKISKIQNLQYFDQARCGEHANFISVCLEGHSVIWYKNILTNLKISPFL
jgi:hypothetical protein